MKKSKFLKSSKDLLSRSFNPSKCKTSLRLAGSRLKLLRNKKEVQVKQMKREIAQLLESGKDRTARIRVEHVIREEKMMAAYDLIEIYCELLVARLPIIESQKTCPIDLKEAIASVVFASPRLGDVPELPDVRKHLTEKYGKDFTTAAIELRPECGVSRMLVEKLSATAPDGQTKMKVLTAIAEEHNVKWDPNSFGEKDSAPPSDLLTGASTFVMDSKLDVEPTRFEGPDFQVPQSDNKMHGSPLNLSQLDNRTSLETERFPAGSISGVNTAFRHETRPLGNERAQLFQGGNISLDRQRWNMGFKDATSAAQAAAESAELASMAARAAAELSSRGRIMRQYSTESHIPDDYVLNDGGPERYADSKLASEQFEELNRSFSEHTRLHSELINGMRPNNRKTDERFMEGGHSRTKDYSPSVSLKSKASTDDPLDHDVPALDVYSGKNSLKEDSRGEMSIRRQSFKYRAESANGRPEKPENVREERIGKQPSVISAHSHSSTFNDVDIFSNSEDQKFVYDAGEDPFLGFGKEFVHREASRVSAAPVFDKSDSDSDTHGFDMGPTYDEQEQGIHFPLSGRKPREHLSTNIDSLGPRSRTSKIVNVTPASPFLTRKISSDFPEYLRSMDGSKFDDSVPVTFDESDGATSESDKDINISRRSGISGPSKHAESVGSQFKDKNRQSVRSPLKEKRSSGFDRKQLSLSFDDDMKSEELDGERYQGKQFDADPPVKFSPGKPSANQPTLEPESEGLNFEKLTGGFRRKGYNRPPYLKNQFDVPSSNKETEETTATIRRSTVPPAVESPSITTMLEHMKSTSTPELQSESDSDSSEAEESLWKSSDHKRQLYTRSAGNEVKPKPSLAASNSIFGSDNSDLDVAPPKESTTRTSHLRSGISRRTKVSPSSGTKNYSKMQLRSEDLDESMDRKTRTANISETPKKSESQRNSSKLENYEQPTSAKVASKPTYSSSWGTQNQYSSGKPNSVTARESKITPNSSAIEESTRPPPKTEASVSSENRRAATLNKTSSNKDDRNQKASHVHPKLPDYDTLVQSLRKNRS